MNLEQRFRKIATDPNLSAKQKSQYLALEADASMDYMPLSQPLKEAKEAGVICDMFEGNAPFKPRYVLPDYGKFLAQGSAYLELEPAQDFDDALNALTIIYHHVPSVTNIPVYLGHLDNILLPYVKDLDDEQIYNKLKRFWIMLDRCLPDAFMHVNIGPTDNVICRTILKVDADLKQVAPNLTFMYDPDISPDDLLRQACDNICQTSKPHIANYPIHADTFDGKGFGIVSCYNALPLAGGANTLVRMNLKALALEANSITHFFTEILPYYNNLMFELIELRSQFLHQESHFFESFLVKEGLIEEDRFAPMYGIYGMAEAVEALLGKSTEQGQKNSVQYALTQNKQAIRYGHEEKANQLGYRISATLSGLVTSRPVTHGYQGHALLHAQGGISLDIGVTPGVRIPYGKEPDPVTHIKAVVGHHAYYPSGISDILTLDRTVKDNPEAMYQLCRAGLSVGLREFTANVESNDLVRVTGYMVKLSDIAAFKEIGSRMNTTGLGAEAVSNTGILTRKPRVMSQEMEAGAFKAKIVEEVDSEPA